MDLYPLKFQPIYKEKIWGGRNLERLFDRTLPSGEEIGESWELADLPEGVSLCTNGPMAGTTLTEITARAGADLLGGAQPMPNGRFPLLLKFLDANDILSLQVHPDAEAAQAIGGDARMKTECWYCVESRDGYIYKGVKPGVSPEQFGQAIQCDQAEEVVRRIDMAGGDFHYLPAGTVHAVGPGLVLAEVQTPSDTTYRVTDWGRGRQVHLERSMQCIRFDIDSDTSPGAQGERMLVTDYFTVARRTLGPDGGDVELPPRRCVAIMFLSGFGPTTIRHGGDAQPTTNVHAGDTLLVPASLEGARLASRSAATWLEISLPEA